METKPQCSVLGGCLTRGPGTSGMWLWSDGAAEPRARDLSPSSEYNFRVRSHGGAQYVEIRYGIAASHADLRVWLDGYLAGTYGLGSSGDHSGPRAIRADGSTYLSRINPGDDPHIGHEPILRDRPIPPVILVPISDWDAWAAAHPMGCSWDMSDEDAILARARSLGWEMPE